MNVFVLGTGRCGTATFTEACRHLTNYTAGHETLSATFGPNRVVYPENHIEADNRLSWFLPQLEDAYLDREVRWVHLRRDREATARSYLRRLDTPYRGSIMTAFAHAIIKHPRDWPKEIELDIARYYVDTVTVTIERFLQDKPHVTVWLEDMPGDFDEVLSMIGAEGDLDSARAEWSTRHNAS